MMNGSKLLEAVVEVGLQKRIRLTFVVRQLLVNVENFIIVSVACASLLDKA